MLDCARAVPLWTSAMDPFVLDASVEVGGCLLDLSHLDHRVVRADGRSHLLLELPAGMLQLDLRVTGSQREIVALTPTIDLARPIEPQFHSARRLAALVAGVPEPVSHEAGLARLVAALRVRDALAAGASQRDIGLGIFGKEWPGDGEHLKSRVRRMIPFASTLVRAGPRAVLAGLI